MGQNYNYMNLHEYQGKEILAQHGVGVQRGYVAENIVDAVKGAKQILKDTDTPCFLVKAQIHAGGRGKGGGIKLAKSIEEVKSISDKVKNSIISLENVDESTIIDHLYTRNLPPVDLLIRTSGEERISNFLLWHIAYAELYFTKTLWPDFTKDDLNKALSDYCKRERRFGKTSEQIN